MEKLVGYCLSVLLVAGFSSVSAQEEEVYLKEGETLQLRPSSVSGEITSIAWKFKGDFVAEWVKDKIPVTYYPAYLGRTTLNTDTGSLEINNTRPTDSGLFSVEINNNVQPKTYNVKLIEVVPKPTVVVKPVACNHESKQCTLVCEGNTEGAEPVTYSWNLGGDEWKNEGKNWNIINDETIHHVEKFICRIKNRISVEDSNPEKNPFFKMAPEGSGAGLAAGLCVFFLVIVLVVVAGGVAYFKPEWIPESISRLFNRRGNDAGGEVQTVYAEVSQKDNGVEHAAEPEPPAKPGTTAEPEPPAKPGTTAEPEPPAKPGVTAEPELGVDPGAAAERDPGVV